MNDNHEKYSLSGKSAEMKGDDLKEKDVESVDSKEGEMNKQNEQKRDTSLKPKGGYVRDKSRILTRVITPDLEYSQLRAIYEEAFFWYGEVKEARKTAKKIGWVMDMPMGLIITDYIVFRFWRSKHEVWDKRGVEICKNYRDAFDTEDPRFAKYLEDEPVLLDLAFYAWFAFTGKMRHPPQPRAQLLKRAQEMRDAWEGN